MGVVPGPEGVDAESAIILVEGGVSLEGGVSGTLLFDEVDDDCNDTERGGLEQGVDAESAIVLVECVLVGVAGTLLIDNCNPSWSRTPTGSVTASAEKSVTTDGTLGWCILNHSSYKLSGKSYPSSKRRLKSSICSAVKTVGVAAIVFDLTFNSLMSESMA